MKKIKTKEEIIKRSWKLREKIIEMIDTKILTNLDINYLYGCLKCKAVQEEGVKLK